MSNEEKAEELAKGFGIDYYAKGSRYPIDHSFDECYKAAIEMAEWKDGQFKEVTARVRKWLYEHGKLDKPDLVEFDMEMEKLWEEKK